jgi:hypothetical protein
MGVITSFALGKATGEVQYDDATLVITQVKVDNQDDHTIGVRIVEGTKNWSHDTAQGVLETVDVTETFTLVNTPEGVDVGDIMISAGEEN